LLTGTMFRLTLAVLSYAEQGHPFCYYALQRKERASNILHHL